MSPVRSNGNSQPGTLIAQLLRAGLGAPAASIRLTGVGEPDGIDWAHLCAVAYRCRIAPVLYQCLRAASPPVSADVMDWFRVQYYETVARNMALLNELRELLGWLSGAAVPAIVLKGPALAQLGLGSARVSYDLDVIVHNTDLRRVDAVLRSHGHRALASPPHDYHRRYARVTAVGARVAEIHFDISDRPRSHRPDLAGIWDRSVQTTISGVVMRVPELLDHFLLTIMQLPHHHWAVRLMVDLWQVVLRWGDEIDWPAVLERAGRWQMRVLTRAALHALWAMFGAPVEPSVLAASSPCGYFERVQWGAARRAIAEQLEHPFRPKVMYAVPYLMVDQPSRIPGLLLRRSLGSGGPPGESMMLKAARRNLATITALPALGRVLLEGLAPARLHPDGKGNPRGGSR